MAGFTRCLPASSAENWPAGLWCVQSAEALIQIMELMLHPRYLWLSWWENPSIYLPPVLLKRLYKLCFKPWAESLLQWLPVPSIGFWSVGAIFLSCGGKQRVRQLTAAALQACAGFRGAPIAGHYLTSSSLRYLTYREPAILAGTQSFLISQAHR